MPNLLQFVIIEMQNYVFCPTIPNNRSIYLYMEPKKYINFKDFYSNADSFAEIINKKFLNIENARKIIFARELFTKDLLNSYFIAGFLSVDVKGLLGSNTNILKFSMDNMIKNQLAHPEVTYEDYQKIPLIIKSPSKYFKSKNGYDVIVCKEDESFEGASGLTHSTALWTQLEAPPFFRYHVITLPVKNQTVRQESLVFSEAAFFAVFGLQNRRI